MTTNPAPNFHDYVIVLQAEDHLLVYRVRRVPRDDVHTCERCTEPARWVYVPQIPFQPATEAALRCQAHAEADFREGVPLTQPLTEGRFHMVKPISWTQ